MQRWFEEVLQEMFNPQDLWERWLLWLEAALLGLLAVALLIEAGAGGDALRLTLVYAVFAVMAFIFRLLTVLRRRVHGWLGRRIG